MEVSRTGILLRPDNARVFFRPFDFVNPERVLRIVARVTSMTEAEVAAETDRVMHEFEGRHAKLKAFLLERFDAVKHRLLTDQPISQARRILIGAYFSQEYSLESAALFNPSIVPHPDQSGLPAGSLRFIVSLRATGEGHISSIVFRSGTVNNKGAIHIDPTSRFVIPPEVHPNPSYDKPLFIRKLMELGLQDPFAMRLMDALPDQFTLDDLRQSIELARRRDRTLTLEQQATGRGLISLAQANYEVNFDPSHDLSARVIFPYAPSETRGIEDARFVAFHEDDGSVTYYATYTAYDGQVILPQLLETRDFLRFRVGTLNGPEVQNKGMALFPRKIGGLYCMISRQDQENLFLMFSDLLHFWYSKQILLRPTFPWEFVQIGNCGSPIETDAGWLVLTHGVGAMRKYAIGAILLDKHRPDHVLGRLREPLLTANASEREGYVPNVVYSCGALVHGGQLILPYAMSDQISSFATVPINDLLDELLKSPVSPV